MNIKILEKYDLIQLYRGKQNTFSSDVLLIIRIYESFRILGQSVNCHKDYRWLSWGWVYRDKHKYWESNRKQQSKKGVEATSQHDDLSLEGTMQQWFYCSHDKLRVLIQLFVFTLESIYVSRCQETIIGPSLLFSVTEKLSYC